MNRILFKRTNWCGVFIWLFCLMFLIACNQQQELANAPTDTPTSGEIQISVDESFKPVIEAQIKVFEASFPGTKINAIYKPEAACLKDLFNDSATRLVITTRSLTYKEAKFFADTLHYVPRSEKLASDAIVIIVNNSCTDTLFTLAKLQEMFTGLSKSKKTIVFDGLSATSTVRFAMDSILKGKKFDSNSVKAVKTSKDVLDYVSSDTNVVGFVGISWIGNPEDTSQVRLLKKIKICYVKCEVCFEKPYVKPTQMGIMSRRYPLVRGLFYILKENFSGLGSGFTSFLQYERGQLIFSRAYLWPAAMSFNVRNVHLNEKLKKD